MFLRRMGVFDADPEDHAGQAAAVEDIGVHAAAGRPEPGLDAQRACGPEGVRHDRMRLGNGKGLKGDLLPDGKPGAGG